MKTALFAGVLSWLFSLSTKVVSVPAARRDSSSSREMMPILPSIREMQGWLSGNSMAFQGMPSSTYSAWSSLKTCERNCCCSFSFA